MSVEPGLLDANILVYAVEADAPQHAISRALIEAARDPATALYLTSQVLCEFYSVVTNPRRVAVPRSPTEAIDAVSALLALPGIRLLSTPARAVTAWIALLQRHPVTRTDGYRPAGGRLMSSAALASSRSPIFCSSRWSEASSLRICEPRGSNRVWPRRSLPRLAQCCG